MIEMTVRDLERTDFVVVCSVPCTINRSQGRTCIEVIHATGVSPLEISLGPFFSAPFFAASPKAPNDSI
jgi:hypothetical protein